MSRAPALALLAIVPLLIASCTDQDPAGPDQQVGEPNFSMHMSECWPDDVVGQINALFPDNGTRVAALAMFDNIVRDVDSGRLANAVRKAKAFDRFVNNHSPDRIEDPCAGDLPMQEQAEIVLIGNVYAVAGGNPPLVIPPGAYGLTGGIGLIDPVTGGTVLTNNMEAAVVADEDAFDGTGLVMIVLTRLPDPVVGQPPGSGPIPGYQAYPEGYDIISGRQLTPLANGGTGAIVELCVVTDGLDPAIDGRLVIGHDLGEGNAELLYPRRIGGMIIAISCGDAGQFPPVVTSTTSPWLNLARRLIAPAKRLISPKPLHAMYFAGRGLGGRTTSFSNFAPVDPWSLSVSPESATLVLEGEVVPTVQLTATLTVPGNETHPPVPFPDENSDFTWTSIFETVAEVDGDGLVTAESEGTTTVTASYDGLSATSEITVEVPTYTLTVDITGNGTVTDDGENIDCPGTCSAEFEQGTTVRLYWDPASGWYLPNPPCDDIEGYCDIFMDDDQDLVFDFEEFEGLM